MDDPGSVPVRARRGRRVEEEGPERRADLRPAVGAAGVAEEQRDTVTLALGAGLEARRERGVDGERVEGLALRVGAGAGEVDDVEAAEQEDALFVGHRGRCFS